MPAKLFRTLVAQERLLGTGNWRDNFAVGKVA